MTLSDGQAITLASHDVLLVRIDGSK